MTQNPPDMKVRLSAPLRAQIEAAARGNNRTLNAEIISRLEASFRDETDDRSAAAAKTLLRLSPSEDPVPALEKRVDELSQRVENLQSAVQHLSLNSDNYHLENRIRTLENKN